MQTFKSMSATPIKGNTREPQYLKWLKAKKEQKDLQKYTATPRTLIYPFVKQYNTWLKNLSKSPNAWHGQRATYFNPKSNKHTKFNPNQLVMNNQTVPKPMPFPASRSKTLQLNIFTHPETSYSKSFEVLEWQATFTGMWNRTNAAVVFGAWASWQEYLAIQHHHTVIALIRFGTNSPWQQMVKLHSNNQTHLTLIDLLMATFGLHMKDSKLEETLGSPLLETETLNWVSPRTRTNSTTSTQHAVQAPFPTTSNTMTVQIYTHFPQSTLYTSRQQSLFGLFHTAQKLKQKANKLTKATKPNTLELSNTLDEIYLWEYKFENWMKKPKESPKTPSSN